MTIEVPTAMGYGIVFWSQNKQLHSLLLHVYRIKTVLQGSTPKEGVGSTKGKTYRYLETITAATGTRRATARTKNKTRRDVS